MAVSHTHGDPERARKELPAGRGGFTLVELLTALVIMGIATTIFVNLYTASVTLANANRGQRVAANLAEEYMTYILNYPREIDWSPVYGEEPASGDAESPGKLILVARPDTAEEGPAAMLRTAGRSYNRVKNLYRNFTHEVHARIPETDAEYLEVVVVVRWTQGRRNLSFSLTSAIPRGRVPEPQSTRVAGL